MEAGLWKASLSSETPLSHCHSHHCPGLTTFFSSLVQHVIAHGNEGLAENKADLLLLKDLFTLVSGRVKCYGEREAAREGSSYSAGHCRQHREVRENL